MKYGVLLIYKQIQCKNILLFTNNYVFEFYMLIYNITLPDDQNMTNGWIQRLESPFQIEKSLCEFQSSLVVTISRIPEDITTSKLDN